MGFADLRVVLVCGVYWFASCIDLRVVWSCHLHRSAGCMVLIYFGFYEFIVFYIFSSYFATNL